MNISPLVLTIRAVSTEFARRIYMPIVITVGVILLVLICVLIWLVTVSGWWWLALAPLLVVSTAFTIIALFIGLLINVLRPDQTKQQSKEVRAFVDTLQEASETIQTPKFILLLRLAKDAISPSERGFVREISTRSSSLKSGFQKILASFK